MNLFVTHTDPEICAQNLDDKRVGKLLMEANQMLSLAIKVRLDSKHWEPFVGPGMLTAGLSHKNHPVSIWVRDSFGNFGWTLQHAMFLGREFEHRFGKKHDSARRTSFIYDSGLSAFLFNVMSKDDPKTEEMRPFQNSARHGGLGIDFTHLPVPESYQAYLRNRWQGDARAPRWTNREVPEWV